MSATQIQPQTINSEYIDTRNLINPITNIPYNYTPEQTNRMLRQLLEGFRVQIAQRSTEVITEEYMELPPAEDEADASEADASEADESHNSQVPLSGERLESEERIDDSDSESESDPESESELQVQCQEITGKPLADLLVSLGECSICLDPIDQLVNVSNTRCGHTFHTHCFLRAIQSGSGNCPNCRALLVVKDEDDSDDESDYYSDDDDNNSDEDESNSTISDIVTLEQTASKLQNLGYSVADILAFYVGTTIRSETPEKYNTEFFIKMNEDLDGILDGRIPLSQRDTRSYAAVASSSSTSQL